jgi:hypothetical protein
MDWHAFVSVWFVFFIIVMQQQQQQQDSLHDTPC